MKKIISLIMTIIILATISITSFAESDYYDVYAYGNFETEGANIFYATFTIRPIENVESLELTINYNEENLNYSKKQFPDYITVNETHTNGRIVLKLSSTGNFFEDEKITLTFTSEKSHLTQEEIGFDATAKAVFKDGSSRNLVVKTNVEIYIHMPEMIPENPEIYISADKKLFVTGETVSYTIPVIPVKNAEKVAVKFKWNKDILSLKECYFTENFVMEKCAETEDGFEAIFIPQENDSGTIVVRFDVVKKGTPDMNITGYGIDTDGNKFSVLFNTDILVNAVYDPEQIGKIVLSGRIDIYRTDDILYLPFTVTEKFFENGLFSTAEGCPADLTRRFASSGYTDRAVATGETITTCVSGIVMDKITICIAGDINKNGTVTAADARLALRYAAKLDSYNDIEQLAADTDKDGKVTAGDSRKILRVAASTDSFAPAVKTISAGESFTIDKIFNSGSGAYNWVCTVSDPTLVTIEETTKETDNTEIKDGAPVEQIFKFTGIKTGECTVRFELKTSWDDTPADTFEFILRIA